MALEFIADPSSNYVGDMKQLKELALMSQKAGATFFKPQIYNASELYKSENNPYYELQQACSLSFEQVTEIHNYCKKIGIKPMFSCFHEKHLQWIEEIDCNLLKISASMAGNREFISEASNYGFNVIISLSPDKPHFSIWDYNDLFKNAKFMYCRTIYPSSILDYNLEQIRVLEGVSCHCPDICLPISAVSVGANLVEKHIWHRWHNTPDIFSSIHTSQLKDMINVCNNIASIR